MKRGGGNKEARNQSILKTPCPRQRSFQVQVHGHTFRRWIVCLNYGTLRPPYHPRCYTLEERDGTSKLSRTTQADVCLQATSQSRLSHMNLIGSGHWSLTRSLVFLRVSTSRLPVTHSGREISSPHQLSFQDFMFRAFTWLRV